MKSIDRRTFLKTLGLGSVATVGVAVGCKSPNTPVVEGVDLGEVPTDGMTYRENLHGDKVSLLGFGCMRLPYVEREESDESAPVIDQERVEEMFDYAIAHGVNLFDTAPTYLKGQSESAVGQALSRHDRSKYYVSTKLSNFAPSTWSREASMAMYRNSFKSLQVDCLDYYMLHCCGVTAKDADGNELDPLQAVKTRFIDNGMLDFLIEERSAGRIRNLGFSYHGGKETFEYMLSLNEKVHWDHVLIQHNYCDWKHADTSENTDSEYLYGRLESLNIPIFVMEPLLGGQLATLPEHSTAELKARQPQRSIASWAFRFAGAQPRILTVLSGMSCMEHLQDNIRTFSPLEQLSDEDCAVLEEVAKERASFSLVPCTGCKYCMPCPYGIDIPGVFQHYNKCIGEGSLITDDDIAAHLEGDGGSARRAYRKARRAFLVGYDGAVPKLRQADHCIGCNQCLVHCPQKIKIPEEMQRIDRYVEKVKRAL